MPDQHSWHGEVLLFDSPLTVCCCSKSQVKSCISLYKQAKGVRFFNTAVSAQARSAPLQQGGGHQSNKARVNLGAPGHQVQRRRSQAPLQGPSTCDGSVDAPGQGTGPCWCFGTSPCAQQHPASTTQQGAATRDRATEKPLMRL